MYAGTLPASWGGTAAFPLLLTLQLFDMPLSGKLPASWGSKGSMPSLTTLHLGADHAGFSLLSGAEPKLVTTVWQTTQTFGLPQIARGFCSCQILETCISAAMAR